MTNFEMFDYATSPLNPLLKLVITLIFIIIFFIYYDTRKKFGGEIRRCIDLLLLFTLFMTLGSFFRIFGHGTEFGFNSDYSLKWLQSIAYLIGSASFILAAYKLHNLFRSTHE